MPLNIKNPEVERLAAQVAAMMGETKNRSDTPRPPGEETATFL